MPVLKRPTANYTTITSTKAYKPQSGSSSVQVQKGNSSTATKEAVKSNADRHRAAMIRLADR